MRKSDREAFGFYFMLCGRQEDRKTGRLEGRVEGRFSVFTLCLGRAGRQGDWEVHRQGGFRVSFYALWKAGRLGRSKTGSKGGIGERQGDKVTGRKSDREKGEIGKERLGDSKGG